MHKQIQIKKEVAVAVGNSSLASENWPGGEKTVEDKLPAISVNNRYAILLEDSEEESLEKPEEIDRLKDTGVAVVDPGIMNNGTVCHSGASKIKLAKELKSLGPLEPKYKKKKRDGRLNSMSGEGSPAMVKIVSFVVKETSSQVIVGDLSIPILGSWKVATVNGSRCCKERGSLWSQLEKCMKDSIPSIISGDFNYIFNKEEKRGGKRFFFSKGPRDMKYFMTNSDFHDVRSIGPRFTWCNNKEGASRIWERVDRCLVNSVALQKLPLALTRHLERVASDHSQIVFKLDERVRINLKNIKIEDTWRSYPAARSIVNHSWKKNDFGDECMILQRKLNRTLKSVDDLFFLRSKVHDLNVTLRRLSTWVVQIKDVHNNLQDEDDQIEKVFIHYFEAKWKSRDCELSGWPLVSESQKLNSDEVAALNSEFSVNELQLSVFQQGNNRSPDTLLVLIAKVKNSLIPSNYRPISLCQTNYKIADTILVNILKSCISKMITEEQMAFIPRRSISEHCLLAQEIFHKFKISKNKKGLMAIKLDMEQAYDSMGWPTLGQILKWYGFPSIISNLLMECVVDRGQTLGIKVSPRGPRITHLLYADDVLIFSHVSMVLAKALKVIVENFCQWTGQRINVSKS
ncbi:hypothetical protein KFK09_014160 [Dendrobium nobile]|uniref:Reverse transcriptase domain-containing protein n=1 Tax=Dendrobium nobile TaxID=94219 RepID=A0A8T3BC68_DENNO|nr:hypothetical protein KFK09_014160 [Dendrobium nobile]